MRKLLTILFFALTAVSLFGQAVSSTQMKFTYTIPLQVQTSAGVYDSTGGLIRTLWSNQVRQPGTFTYAWNGLDDLGNQAPAGNYTIKVLRNNVTYTWDGPIGNTGNSWTSDTNNWTGFGLPPFIKLCFVDGTGWIADAESEGQYNLGWLDSHNPNSPHILNPNYLNQVINFSDCATDGTNMYMMNEGGAFATITWTTIFGATTMQSGAFTNGTALVGQTGSGTANNGFNNTTLSIIDQGTAGTNIPTGIAVQPSGNILAISHGSFVFGNTNPPGTNTVFLYDKVTGLATGTNITINDPQQMAFSANGLWVISGSTLALVTGVGTSNTITNPITGLSNPVAVAVERNNNHLFVLDGGTSQQLKEYDATNTLVRTYGDLGGYTDHDPNITLTRLNLDSMATLGTTTRIGAWVSVQENGDVWFSDAGTGARILHVTPSGNTFNYVNQIDYTPTSYNAVIDHNDPTRLFRAYLEYQIDYSVPNQPGDPDPTQGGNGSWKLVRNWEVSGPASLPVGVSDKDVMLSVETLSNGRTYAQVITGVPGGSILDDYEVELPATGPMRYIQTDGRFLQFILQRDGSLTSTNPYSNAVTTSFSVTKQALTGFDSSGNPLRAAAVNVATVNVNPDAQPININGWSIVTPMWPTTGGVYPIYQAPFKGTLGFPHLAGVVAGRSSYLWMNNRERCMVYPDFQGGFSCVDGFGGHAGIAAPAEGHHIIAGYDGQYATWGNSYSDYYEDGLLVGEFTQANPSRSRVINVTPPIAPSGFAGNIGGEMLATVGSDIYMYIPTESGFLPIERWDIGNLSSIHEDSGTGALGDSITLTRLF